MKGYAHPINELNAIVEHMPQMYRDQIKMWIRFNIVESHVVVKQHQPFNKEHAEYRVESAMHELGTTIAKNNNSYPTWKLEEDGTRTMRLSALHFKNEYGV